MRSTLVLNASYAPLNSVPARRALQLLGQGKAVSLVDSPVIFSSENESIFLPYVILRTTPVKDDFRFKRRIPFSRYGMYVRDNYLCVYCNNPGNTIDHVVPRALGGITSYENCVTACKRCNHKKGHKTLNELGWDLPRTPVAPSHITHLFSMAPKDIEGRNAWLEYLTMFEPSLLDKV